MLSDGDPVLREGPGRPFEGAQPLPQGSDEIPPAVALVEAFEVLDHRRTADAVRRKPGVALKVGDRGNGVLPEDRVDPTRVEPERRETTLELSDVVATEHRAAEVEQAISEPVPRFHEGTPRRGIEHAGAGETVLLLEPPEGALGRRAEHPGGIVRREVEFGETELEVEGCPTLDAVFAHGVRPYRSDASIEIYPRCGSRSASRALLDFAPTTRS